MQLALDTKSDLGVLMSKREIVIASSRFEDMQDEYMAALRGNNTEAADKLRAKIASTWFKNRITPGQECKVNSQSQVNCGDYPGPDKLSAVVKWYPGRKYLRVRAEVVDASLSTDAPLNLPWTASCFEVLVSPSGFSDSVNQFFIVPEGAGGVPRVVGVQTNNESQVIASYKRTDSGYIVDAKIPWSILRGYKKGWSLMPVEAQLNCKTPNGRVQMVMNQPGHPWEDAKTYAGLKAK